MFNVVYDGRIQVKEPEKKYQITKLFDDKIYEADDFRDMVAVVCGQDYYESQSAETDWHMRVAAAKELGLALIAATEIDLEQRGELAEDEEIEEFIIMYDERIGKLPYSVTGPEVDYNIHGQPKLIRVESNKSFLWTLEKTQLIAVYELDEEKDEYVRWLGNLDLDALITEEVRYFKECGDQTRVPLFKKLGE